MKITIIASLLAATAALAEPTPATTPACAAKGTPIVEIDHDIIKDAKLPTSQLKIYDSGAWVTTGADENGKPVAPQNGCLDKAVLDKIRADLKAATWKVKHNRIHCMMVSATFTTYKVDGKQVWQAKACSSDSLDDASAKAIADIESELVAAKVMQK
jgi:hypothetical protein